MAAAALPFLLHCDGICVLQFVYQNIIARFKAEEGPVWSCLSYMLIFLHGFVCSCTIVCVCLFFFFFLHFYLEILDFCFCVILVKVRKDMQVYHFWRKLADYFYVNNCLNANYVYFIIIFLECFLLFGLQV